MFAIAFLIGLISMVAALVLAVAAFLKLAFAVARSLVGPAASPRQSKPPFSQRNDLPASDATLARGLVFLLGLVTLGVAGCGSNSNAPNSPLVGKWNVTAMPATIESHDDRKTWLSGERFSTNYDPQDVFYIAIRRRAVAIEEPTDEIEVEFEPNGVCTLIDGSTKEDGSWTLSGETLTQTYRTKTGKPGTVTWDGPDKFTLVRPDGPPLAFERKK